MHTPSSMSFVYKGLNMGTWCCVFRHRFRHHKPEGYRFTLASLHRLLDVYCSLHIISLSVNVLLALILVINPLIRSFLISASCPGFKFPQRCFVDATTRLSSSNERSITMNKSHCSLDAMLNAEVYKLTILVVSGKNWSRCNLCEDLIVYRDVRTSVRIGTSLLNSYLRVKLGFTSTIIYVVSWGILRIHLLTRLENIHKKITRIHSIRLRSTWWRQANHW